MSKLKENMIIANQYMLQQQVGKGAFGQVWKAINLITKTAVAIKFEDIEVKQQQLYAECKLYLWFHCDPRAKYNFVPTATYFGVEKNKNLMVFDILGPSLENLYKKCNRKFSIKTVLMIADQMIKRLSFTHSRNIIHRDIKPDNFVMQASEGPDAKNLVLVDFGLAKKFQNSKGEHIKFKDGKPLTGTARYASCNVHRGYEQSRRDDMEALAYLFIYFLKGTLPWMNLKAANLVEKYDSIRIKKLELSADEVCQGFPVQFERYLQYCKELRFEETPDYDYLRKMFNDLFLSLNFKFDHHYDWSQ